MWPLPERQEHSESRPKIGLVLPGGGARAAYQVGVLKAIAEMLPESTENPFSVITGTSAGAINAAMLAANALHFQQGTRHLTSIWENLKTPQVIRCDSWTVLRAGLHWLFALVHAGLGRSNPRSLLDNQPLRQLLESHIRFAHIQQAIDAGALDAVAINLSGYTSARAISYFHGHPGLKPWDRTRRCGVQARIELNHIMASIALPIIFPAVRIGREYFGDGSMRQSSPMSPAVHLGSDRILVVGVRNETPNQPIAHGKPVHYPSFGQIAGYVLDILFMDSIYTDIERLQRINRTVSHVPENRRNMEDMPNLRHIDTAVVVPSEDIRDIALRHRYSLPRSMRMLLKGVGAWDGNGLQLLSYLLFESEYCRELIALGYKDALNQKQSLLGFIAADKLKQVRVTS